MANAVAGVSAFAFDRSDIFNSPLKPPPSSGDWTLSAGSALFFSFPFSFERVPFSPGRLTHTGAATALRSRRRCASVLVWKPPLLARRVGERFAVSLSVSAVFESRVLLFVFQVGRVVALFFRRSTLASAAQSCTHR